MCESHQNFVCGAYEHEYSMQGSERQAELKRTKYQSRDTLHELRLHLFSTATRLLSMLERCCASNPNRLHG